MFFFALFFAQSVIGCPFENYEDALIPNGQKYYGIEKKINQKNYQDGFSLGFWMLPVSKMNLFDIPGVLFLLMNDDNMIMAANISSDYQQDQPFILIDVYDIGNNKYSINFNYPFYQYYNQQLFTLIQITGNLKTLRIQMTNQQEIKIDHFQIVELIHTYVFSIGDQYTPPITGRISYPIIFDNFQYSPENFNNFQVECKIPDVFQQGIVKNVVISGIQDFFNNKLLQKNYFEYGRKYCLSGWAKYYTQGLERSRQILLRLSLNSVKSYKWTFGDNLFRLDRHLFDQQQGQSKVKVTLDIFCIIDDKNYSLGNSLLNYAFEFQNLQNHFIYKGLLEWHFFQYEYGRGGQENFEILFQQQFFNEAGFLSKQITKIAKESQINDDYYLFIGEKVSDFDYLYASLANVQFMYNYQQDQTFILSKNYSKQDCDQKCQIINEKFQIIQTFGFQKFCDENEQNPDCRLVNYYHLKKQTRIICKPNYIFNLGINDCDRKDVYRCVSYDNNGNCFGCENKMELFEVKCQDCPENCEKCEFDISTQTLKCNQCFFQYGLINNQCLRCGEHCLICQENFSESLNQNILKCLNCHKNYIEDCKYMIEFNKNDEFYQYQEQFIGLSDDIITTCASYKTSKIYDVAQQLCYDTASYELSDQYICYFLIISPVTEICLKAEQKITYATTFIDQCASSVVNCYLCKFIADEISGAELQIVCLICQIGYYANRISGQCQPCPNTLNCKQCGQQQILSQDYWIVELRAFYAGFERLGLQFSQNSEDYEIICTECIEEYTLVNGICIPKCPDSCFECELIENQFKCIRCKGNNQIPQLSIIQNQCSSCPNNCALCRLRTQLEIYNINPQFDSSDDNFKYFSYQCLRSLDNDLFYYYDSFFGQYSICEQDQKCQNEMTIQLNLICSDDEYQTKLSMFDNEEMRIKFQQENILLSDLISGSSFKFQHSEFLKSRNCSEKNQYSHFILQFQNKIKIIHNNVQFIFSNSNLQRNLIFTSLYTQNLLLNNILLKSSLNSFSQIVLQFQNFSTLEINSVRIENMKINNQYFLYIPQQSQKVKLIKVENMVIENCFLENMTFMLFEMSYQDTLNLKNIIVQGTFINSNLFATAIKTGDEQFINQQTLYAGQIFFNDFDLKLNIINSRSFIKVETFQVSSFDNIKISFSKLQNSSIINLNKNVSISNINIYSTELLKESTIMGNSDISNQKPFVFNAENLRFERNKYDQLSHFIVLIKQSSSDQTIQIKNLILKENTGINFSQGFKDYEKSLIYLQANYIKIQDLYLIKGSGLREIFVKEAKNLIIQNFFQIKVSLSIYYMKIQIVQRIK